MKQRDEERNELRNMVYQVETRDFGGYTTRDAHAVADALFDAGYRRQGSISGKALREAMPMHASVWLTNSVIGILGNLGLSVTSAGVDAEGRPTP